MTSGRCDSNRSGSSPSHCTIPSPCFSAIRRKGARSPSGSVTCEKPSRAWWVASLTNSSNSSGPVSGSRGVDPGLKRGQVSRHRRRLRDGRRIRPLLESPGSDGSSQWTVSWTSSSPAARPVPRRRDSWKRTSRPRPTPSRSLVRALVDERDEALGLLHGGRRRLSGLDRVERVALDQRGVQRGEDLGPAHPVEHDEAAADRDQRAGLPIAEADRLVDLVEPVAAALVDVVHRAGLGESGEPSRDLASISFQTSDWSARAGPPAAASRSPSSPSSGAGRCSPSAGTARSPRRAGSQSQRPASTQLTGSWCCERASISAVTSKVRFCWAPSTSSPSNRRTGVSVGFIDQKVIDRGAGLELLDRDALLAALGEGDVGLQRARGRRSDRRRVSRRRRARRHAGARSGSRTWLGLARKARSRSLGSFHGFSE